MDSKDIIRKYCTNTNNAVADQIRKNIITFFQPVNHYPYKKSILEDILNQIETGLKSQDCRILAKLLLLLQELSCKVKMDIAKLWNKHPERNSTFQSYFAHGQQQFSCSWCNLVRSSSANLDQELNTSPGPSMTSKPQQVEEKLHLNKADLGGPLCVSCRSTNVKMIYLPCDHFLCNKCKKEAVRRINVRTGINHYVCPMDNKPCILRWLEDKNNEAKIHFNNDKETIYRRKGKAEENPALPSYQMRNEVTCPKCKFRVYQNPSDIMLAECLPCSFCFCTNCLQEFHGNIDCPTVYNQTNANDGNEKSFQDIGKKDDVAGGAEAKQYELDFYKNSDQSMIDVDEILTAFDTLTLPTQSFEMPWEIDVTAIAEGGIGHLQYNPPYESLRIGEWVEDDLLEKVVDIIITENNIQDKFVMLESFVLNWSLRKSQEDGELARILKEKHLFRKQLGFALINTDTSGHGGHWILAVINIPKQAILLIDSSLVLSNTFYQKFFYGLLLVLHISSQIEDFPIEFTPSNWRLFVSLDALQQDNAYDCGLFAVCNAFSIAIHGSQLDRPLKSFLVREWLHHTITNYKGSATLQENVINTSESGVEQYQSKKMNFKPVGLKIQFDFFKNCKLV